MAYSVRLSSSAERQLAKIERRDQYRIVEALKRLATAPHGGAGIKKLAGIDGYRLRVGDFRVLYEVHEQEVVVLVVKIGHRREVYR